MKALISFKDYSAPSNDNNQNNQPVKRAIGGRGLGKGGIRRHTKSFSDNDDEDDQESTGEFNIMTTVSLHWNIDAVLSDNVNKEKTVAQLKNFLKCLDIILSQPTADASSAFIKLAKKVIATMFVYELQSSSDEWLTSALRRSCLLTKRPREN